MIDDPYRTVYQERCPFCCAPWNSYCPLGHWYSCQNRHTWEPFDVPWAWQHAMLSTDEAAARLRTLARL